MNQNLSTRRSVKFGKEFSSDVTGDGPSADKRRRRKNANSLKRVVATLASIPLGPEPVKAARAAAAIVGRQKKKKREQSRKKSTLILGRCATKLLTSYSEPFSSRADGVCLPIPPFTRTQKVRSYVRGIGYIGAAGFGFVAVAPCLANDAPCVYYTPTAYGMSNLGAPVNNLTWAAQSAGGINFPAWAALPSLPYSSKDLLLNDEDFANQPVDGRICSACLKLTYTGTVLNQSGLMVGYDDPMKANVLGDQFVAGGSANGYYMNNLMSFTASEIETTRKTIMLPITVSSSQQQEFPHSDLTTSTSVRARIYPYSSGAYYEDIDVVRNGHAVSTIAISGVPGQSFFFEYVQFVEYKGPRVPQSMLTEVDADYDGFVAVSDLVNKAKEEAAADFGKTFNQVLAKTMNKLEIQRGSGYRTHTG